MERKIELGTLILAGAVMICVFLFGVQARAFEPYVNPFFKTSNLPVDSKTGVPLISQRENDMTILYGKLAGLSKQIKDLSELTEKIYGICAR